MKALTITVSDAVGDAISQLASAEHRPAEEVAAQAVEATFGGDWFNELDDETKAAVLQGVAEADRGEFATDEEVDEAFARFKR